MTKYEPLYQHLLELNETEWRATFAQVEVILGQKLPKSARVYRPWWSNQGGNSGHSHSMAWTNAGWRTNKVDMQREQLTFVRVTEPRPITSAVEPRLGSVQPTVAERVAEFLRGQPNGATNKEIAIALDRSPTHIYQETILLEQRSVLTSRRDGKAKVFTLVDELPESPTLRGKLGLEAGERTTSDMTAYDFQRMANRVMSDWYRVALVEKKPTSVPKIFDFVSDDESVVGDAKFYTMVRGQGLPPAKFATIAEHVWLLENTGASKKFLVFGNDRRVPQLWLKKYGKLVHGIEFFFLSDTGRLQSLTS